MTVTYLKQATPRPATENNDIRDIVQIMLVNIARGGEEAVAGYAEKLDQFTGDIVLSDTARAAACTRVPDALKADIQFAYANILRFAEAQQTTI